MGLFKLDNKILASGFGSQFVMAYYYLSLGKNTFFQFQGLFYAHDSVNRNYVNCTCTGFWKSPAAQIF
jgi:hypothetical protein